MPIISFCPIYAPSLFKDEYCIFSRGSFNFRVSWQIFARPYQVLPKSCRATTHDFALTDELSVELGAVEGEVDVEVHSLKVEHKISFTLCCNL